MRRTIAAARTSAHQEREAASPLGAELMVYRCVLLLPAIFLTLFSMSGCGGDAYSAAMRYDVRTDPLVKDQNLGPERPDPDPPGQLPLSSPENVLDPRNPLFNDGKGPELFTGTPTKLIDPTKLPAEDRKILRQNLDEMFGTPREPMVRIYPDSLIEQLETELKLGPKTLAEGSRLYRLHCLHCHGLTGDGHGPTAKWVNPHPRDYRQGLFKFQSVDQTSQANGKPSRHDLYRTLEQGIEGTSMPAFNLLRSDELEALISYVIHLSIRGETEFQTITSDYKFDAKTGMLVLSDEPNGPAVYAGISVNRWLESQRAPITPGDYPFDANDAEYEKKIKASVQRGQAIFLATEDKLKEYFPKKFAQVKAASCASCHKDYGRQVKFKFDVWGTLVRPTNLTTGVYRGGRRPIDIYYRVHSGINGSGMLQLGKNLDPDQIWDVVNFVKILPYRAMRQKYGVDIE